MPSRRLTLKTFVAGLAVTMTMPLPTWAKDSQIGTLKVPGATLYYQVRGRGPLLLLIPGGALDSGIYDDLAAKMSTQFTVVTYDPRGNSRSPMEGPAKDLVLDVQGDDAARLIESFGTEPAYVFGSSGGAQIGLNLVARHPALVRKLVAHEPPSLLLLSDPSKELAGDRDIHDTFLRDGMAAAMQKFMVAAGMADGPPPVPPTPEAAASFERTNSNLPYFFAHGMLPLSQYVPDIKALRVNNIRVIVGVGEKSVGETTYRTSLALAEKLAVDAVLFPGDHIGYAFEANAFGDMLLHVLSGT